MKRINNVAIIVQAFVVLLFATCLWLLPLRRIPNFWISFIFSIGSLITYIHLSSQWAKKENPSERFLHLIYPVGCIVIFIFQIIWNLFVLFVSTITLKNILGISQDALLNGTPLQNAPITAFIDIISYITNVDILEIKVLNIAVALNIIVNLFCTIANITLVYWMFSGIKAIRNIDNRVATSTSFIKGIENELRVLASNSIIGTETKEKLEILADQVKYSDPVSRHVLKDIEDDIRTQIDVLTDSVLKKDHEKTTSVINRITTLLKQRNLLCKNSK